MTDEKIKLIIGSLLHDIGKVVYREGDDRRNHSISGYDFLKENGGIDDKEILNCVRYHHISALKGAKLQENDLAYIVYLADNIAAFADRRKKEGEDVSGFDLSVPLQSIFNILNENDQEYYYLPGDMEDKGHVNYPTPEKRSFSKEFYMKIRQRVLDNFKGMDWNDEYLNSLLAVMEANLTYVPSSTSINRIGVLRADVDNLGQAIVSGFQSKRNGDRYVTLSRTAALSRQLSIFFKYYIRFLLKNGEYSLEGNEGIKERQATIVYSGGDDVFIVGAWNDVIELSVDLQKMFRKYTQGTLSISAGIGIYEDSYPIAAIAQETGAMESESKRMPGKNAVTIMEDGERHLVEEGEEEKEISDGTYSWEEFDQEVIQEKYRALSEFFEDLEDRGMAFLYRMLELVRGHEEKINFARMMYLLSRLEPSEEGPKKEKYRQLSKKMYEWIQSDQDCRQLKTAINLYAYMNRKGEGKDED